MNSSPKRTGTGRTRLIGIGAVLMTIAVAHPSFGQATKRTGTGRTRLIGIGAVLMTIAVAHPSFGQATAVSPTSSYRG